MSRFAALQTLNVGDALPDAWVDEVKAFHDWAIISGGNLASASTINPTSGYHNLTGTTQVNTITDATGPVAGQELSLKVVGSAGVGVVFGTSGNIITPSGGSQYHPVGALVQFMYDGTSWILLDVKAGGYSQYFDIVSNSGLATIFTQSIPAGLMGLTGGFEIICDGRYANASGGTRTLLFQVSLGGTIMWGETIAFLAASSTNRVIRFVGKLANQNAANSQQLNGYMSISDTVNASIGTNPIGGPAHTDFGFGTLGGTAAVDTAGSAQTLLVQVQHSISNASLEFKGTVHVNILQ